MQLPDELHQVEPGWHPLLMRLHNDLVAIDPNYQLGQVKEKYGTLRVYIDYRCFTTGPRPRGLDADENRMQDLVAAAETESGGICEFCGKPGQINDDRIWVKTTCEECG